METEKPTEKMTTDKEIYYINRGHEILDEKYWEDWDKYVPTKIDDVCNGLWLGWLLTIVKELNFGHKLETVQVIIDSQGHSLSSWELMLYDVSRFCDRGKDFAEYSKLRRYVTTIENKGEIQS